MSTPSVTIEEFIRHFEEELQLAPGSVTAGTRLAQVQRFDSMGRLSFMAMADTKYGIVLDADAIDACATLAELHALAVKIARG